MTSASSLRACAVSTPPLPCTVLTCQEANPFTRPSRAAHQRDALNGRCAAVTAEVAALAVQLDEAAGRFTSLTLEREKLRAQRKEAKAELRVRREEEEGLRQRVRAGGNRRIAQGVEQWGALAAGGWGDGMLAGLRVALGSVHGVNSGGRPKRKR